MIEQIMGHWIKEYDKKFPFKSSKGRTPLRWKAEFALMGILVLWDMAKTLRSMDATMKRRIKTRVITVRHD